jgi:membrane-bound metal-dependent hydrolase YbcI (DUF457 family)
MLLFGHIGLSLLIVFLLLLALKIGVDYRFVIVGSMLPDIIDKPLGEYILKDFFNNGRIVSHTLVFIAILGILALLVAKKYQFWGIGVLTLGAFLHQIEDQMWNAPASWFWPTFGWEFPKHQMDNYVLYLLDNLMKSPEVYVPELIGAIIVAAFILRFRLYRPENARAFIISGRLPVSSKVKPVAVIKQ